MLWSEDEMKTPVMTFPIKKSIDTELFIGEGAAHYIQKGACKSNG